MSFQAGEYIFRVSAQGFGKNQTGSDFFFLEGEPVALKKDDQEYEITPARRTIRLTITEKTVDFVIDKLTSVGWPGGKWSTLDPSEANHHSFVDQEISVRCTMKPGKDDPSKLFENWDIPFSGSSLESDPSISRKLDSMFGKSAAAAKKPAARKTALKQTETAGATAGDGDDIPF